MSVSTGAAMVLTAGMMSAYRWASGCDTCMAAEDGGFGTLLTGAGVILLVLGGPLERWWRRRADRRFEV